MGTVTNAVVRFERSNPKLYRPARVRGPAWIPEFLWPFCDPHIGEQGTVIDITRGQYSKEMLYTLTFEKNNETTTGAYFEGSLEFL